MSRRCRPVPSTLLALGVGLSLPSTQATSTYNFGGRVGGAILHYEFSHDECLSSTFTDSASNNFFGGLVRTGRTECLDGLGVGLHGYKMSGNAQVVSQNDATAFLSAMNGETALTLEFWKESSSNNDPEPEYLPIVTIGAVDDTSENECLNDYSHITYSLTACESEYDPDAAGSTGGKVPGRTTWGRLEGRKYFRRVAAPVATASERRPPTYSHLAATLCAPRCTFGMTRIGRATAGITARSATRTRRRRAATRATSW